MSNKRMLVPNFLSSGPTIPPEQLAATKALLCANHMRDWELEQQREVDRLIKILTESEAVTPDVK